MQAVLGALHGPDGKVIDAEWMKRVGGPGGADVSAFASRPAPKQPESSFGVPDGVTFDAGGVMVASPALPRGAADAARASDAYGGTHGAQPQVNITVSGNMPPGWIETKIGTAVQEHHDTTWRNAAAATQADEDE